MGTLTWGGLARLLTDAMEAETWFWQAKWHIAWARHHQRRHVQHKAACVALKTKVDQKKGS